MLWQYGTYKPIRNQWSWTNLTNMVWVEQPVGTGFSQGTPTATSEADVAAQFLGFFKNFVDLFALQGYTIYIAGESYAGYYVPYIADAMFNKNDTEYYNVSSILIYDPSLSYDVVQEQIPVTAFVDYWAPLLDLNASFVEQLHNMSDTCGYTQFMNEGLVFPPKGPLPTPPNVDLSDDSCDTFDAVYYAMLDINPCFDIVSSLRNCCRVDWSFSFSLLCRRMSWRLTANSIRSPQHVLCCGTCSASPAPSPTSRQTSTSTGPPFRPPSTLPTLNGTNAPTSTSSSTTPTTACPQR